MSTKLRAIFATIFAGLIIPACGGKDDLLPAAERMVTAAMKNSAVQMDTVQESAFLAEGSLKQQVAYDYSTSGFTEVGDFTVVPMLDDLTPDRGRPERMRAVVSGKEAEPLLTLSASEPTNFPLTHIHYDESRFVIESVVSRNPYGNRRLCLLS